MKWIRNLIRDEIHSIVPQMITERNNLLIQHLVEGVVEFREDRSYILILPENIDEKELSSALSKIEVRTNLLVVRANDVKLFEIG